MKKKIKIIAGVLLLAVCLVGCTKMDEDYKTNTTQKGIIIVNPDKIVK